jgi:glyoxylase-like metal-dependent hydrolase (beta-lactamase superfamily II)
MEVVDIPGRMGRCQLILGADGLTLVDSGGDPGARSILAAFADRGLSIRDLRRIVLTHGDGDHIAGARLLQERSAAEVIAHELELAYIAGRVPAGFPIAKRAFGWLGRRLPRPDVTRIVAGDGLELGEIEIIHAPGHTPGHLVVQAGDALLVGDALRTGETFAQVPAPMTVDGNRARQTIRSLAERDVRHAYSGHGPPSNDAGRRLRELAARLPSDRP